ncbi:hypothetical protein [Arthrobacter sp. CAN_C5]|uniref:hypothetical protein n=1 Tax=Arthrobacter sp. CAN_C5 TaxID=2760706 RepID=UPI001AE3E700|nr:hypothetical protein [Arthrobacter sp. CAN_C5]MBP2216536.1 energy-converting hydrogenase Eha subunit C [Arthrobacter sp. CAN_C5]
MMISRAQKTTAAAPRGPGSPLGSDPLGKGHIASLVAGALMAWVVAALLLDVAPFIAATESGVTGGFLLGFAVGWALVAVLSVRFTDRPQKCALGPLPSRMAARQNTSDALRYE